MAVGWNKSNEIMLVVDVITQLFQYHHEFKWQFAVYGRTSTQFHLKETWYQTVHCEWVIFYFLQTEHKVEHMLHLSKDFCWLVCFGKTRGRRQRFRFLLLLPSSKLKELLHCLCTIWCQYPSADCHFWMEWMDRSSRLVWWFRPIFPIRKKPANFVSNVSVHEPQ